MPAADPPAKTSPQNPPRANSFQLIGRLLRIAWRFRWGVIQSMSIQLVLLAMALAGLGFVGLGLDVIHAAINPKANPPNWPLGLNPPDAWSPMLQVLIVAGMVFGIAALRFALDRTARIWKAQLVLNIVVYLRSVVYHKLEQLSFRFFDENESGSIINRVTGDVQAVRAFIDMVLIEVVMMILSLSFFLVYMLSIHVQLTLWCLLTVPLIAIMAVTFSRIVRPAFLKNRQLFDQAVRVLSENAQGVHVVKGFALQQQQTEAFAQANDEVRKQQRWIFWLISLFAPAIQIMPQINLFVLLLVGGHYYIQGEIELGTGLYVFAGLLQQFSGQVSGLAGIAGTIQRSLTGAERVFEVLDTDIDIQSPPHAQPLRQAQGRITFENVSFGYGESSDILHDISFTAEPGQCIAILGATGSGKSSLMSLVPRFYDPREGRITLDGHDLKTLDLDDLRRSIGLVFQESFLFSQSVADNIAFGAPDASMEQIIAAAKIAQAHDFIMDELDDGYDTVLSESGGNLSGGQRQRLAIARAVLLQPAILLLDDPTAAIDPETEHEILSAMDRAMAGRTTLVVAHRLSTLRRADLVIVLDKGRIVQMGTHDELMASDGHYREAAELQSADDESRRLLGMANESAGGTP